MSIPSEAKQEVARLLSAGQKNEAITYLEETFQISLIDAKALVELVERDLNPPADIQPSETASAISANETTQPVQLTETQQSATLWGQVKEEVKALIIAGKKIEAAKLVNDQFRKGLKESLAMVDDVQKEIDPSLIPAASRSGCARKLLKAVAILLGLVSILVLAAAAIANWSIQSQIDQSVRVKGRVVALKQTPEGTFAPVITYEVNGKSLEYTSTYSTKPADYDVNEEVFIFIDRQNPDNIMVDNFTDRWLGILIVAGVGLFFTFFAVMLGFAARKF